MKYVSDLLCYQILFDYNTKLFICFIFIPTLFPKRIKIEAEHMSFLNNQGIDVNS